MARWALSPVIGSGTIKDPYRTVASAYGGHDAILPANEDGQPTYGWALVRFRDEADLAAAAADSRLRVLPAWSLDHVITAGEAAAIAEALDNFGITNYPNPQGRTVGQVLRWIADRLDLTWRL